MNYTQAIGVASRQEMEAKIHPKLLHPAHGKLLATPRTICAAVRGDGQGGSPIPLFVRKGVLWWRLWSRL